MVGTVRLDVGDVTLRIAVGHVVQHAGYRVLEAGGHADSLVTDDPGVRAGAEPVVVVVTPIAAHCLAALRAVLDGRASAVVCADDPERLPVALDALLGGWTVVERRAIEIAGDAPRLDERRTVVLQLVLRGHTNQQLAARLAQSVSTVKRDVAELFALFDATNRLELAANARALGFGGPSAPPA